MVSTRFGVRCCSEFHELEAVSEDWNQLVDNAAYPNVFLRWDWVSIWWKWFGDGRPLRVYLVYDDAQLAGILPLYVRRNLPWPKGRRMVLAPIGFGGPTCPEYLGLIVHPEAVEPVVKCLVTELQSGKIPWSVLELPDVAPDDPGTTALVQRWREASCSISQQGERCPTCSLPESYDALLQRLSGHRRQREKRQLRRAVEEMGAELRTICCPGEAQQLFPTLVGLSASSRAREGQSSPFENQRYAGFHKDVITCMAQAGFLNLFALYFRDQPVAFLYGFLFGGKYYAFQTGFDTGQDRVSPGDVLYQMAFQKLITDGVREFDYLRGDESYKYKFADSERYTTTFYLFRSPGLSYLACRFRFRVLQPVRRVAKRFLSGVRGHFRPKLAVGSHVSGNS